LPVAGLLVDGVELYRQEKLDEAEYKFKQLLHHVPEHAAANFMLGLIYVHKNHLNDAIVLMEKGFKTCPWNKNWRKDLIQVYEMLGDTDKAEALKKKKMLKSEGEILYDESQEMMADVVSQDE